jgi:hypothetical protein
MGRHKHKKVTDKEAEDNITQQLVESGRREELKAMVGNTRIRRPPLYYGTVSTLNCAQLSAR